MYYSVGLFLSAFANLSMFFYATIPVNLIAAVENVGSCSWLLKNPPAIAVLHAKSQGSARYPPQLHKQQYTELTTQPIRAFQQPAQRGQDTDALQDSWLHPQFVPEHGTPQQGYVECSLPDTFYFVFFQYFIVLSSRAQARDPFSRGIVRGKIRRESHSAHRKQQRADRRMDPVPAHGMTALIFCFIMKI
jgi:hypothetical protein